MSNQDNQALSGIIIDEHVEVTLDDICVFCSRSRTEVIALVQEGVLEPTGGTADQWRFSGPSLGRAAKALRLQQDLDINPGAVAVILDLLDERDALRAEIRQLQDRR